MFLPSTSFFILLFIGVCHQSVRYGGPPCICGIMAEEGYEAPAGGCCAVLLSDSN